MHFHRGLSQRKEPLEKEEGKSGDALLLGLPCPEKHSDTTNIPRYSFMCGSPKASITSPTQRHRAVPASAASAKMIRPHWREPATSPSEMHLPLKRTSSLIWTS